jgi:hypothetical protein
MMLHTTAQEAKAEVGETAEELGVENGIVPEYLFFEEWELTVSDLRQSRRLEKGGTAQSG